MNREEKVKRLREQFPKGTKIQLIRMNDSQAPPKGTMGVVDFIDDMGTIFVNWSNGSGLGLIPGEDEFKVIK